MDGYITIGTELSTDKFDKQLNSLEKKIEKEEDKKIVVEARLDTQQQDLDIAIQKTDELADAYERLKVAKEKVESGRATPADFTIFQNLQNQYGTLEQLGNTFDKALSKQEAIQQKLLQTRTQYEQINKRVQEYRSNINKINIQKQVNDVNKLKSSFDNVGSSIQNSISKVGKLALGVFGIRSAYLALRRASSDLAGYDQQYATNLEYIRYVLTQSIAPVLKWIVNLTATLLQYIYAILNAWFGIGAKLNLSAESFNKMKNSAGGVSKAVKEIKKDLLGFDEINRLTDQSSTGTVAGAGGVGIPGFDIGNIGEIPKWLQWIMDNRNLILGVLGTIAGIFATIKIVTFLSSLRNIFGILGGMSNLQIFGIIGGLALTITGIIKTIQGLIKFIDDPSWSNFIEVLNGIEIALIGVGVAMVALNASNPVGWILLAVSAIIELIKQFTKDKAEILDVVDAQKQLKEAIEATNRATDEYVRAIENAENAEKKLAEVERRHKISGEELYNSFKNGTLKYQEMNSAQREVFKAYLNNINAQSELQNATEKLTEASHEEELQNLNTALSIAKETGNYEEFKKATIEAWKANKIEVEDARTVIERAMSDMSASAITTFAQDIPDEIKKGLDPTRYQNPIQKLKTAFETLFTGIKNALKNAFNVNFSIAGGSGSGGGSISARAKGGIFYPSMLPKLAVGGIINQPGRGMAYNGAIIGERGAEAVVPLTDSQQMELLGATIGKYITINANIVNTMNGRIISRELKQVQNEQDFAYNT